MSGVRSRARSRVERSAVFRVTAATRGALLLALLGFALPPGASSAPTRQALDALPLRLEANQGQAPAAADFLARGPGWVAALAAGEATFRLDGSLGGQTEAAAGAVVRMAFVGAGPSVARGEELLPTRTTYLLGRDPAAWIRDVPSYARVVYEDVYPGIDVAWRGRGGALEYDFELAPGADPRRIRLAFSGAGAHFVDADGSLVLRTPAGDLRLLPPECHQEESGERRAVHAAYALREGGEVGFTLANYDPSRPLVIDPVVRYATWLGGMDDDLGHEIAVDAAGAAYVVGQTLSTDFPATGVLGGDVANGHVLYVAKLNPAGSALEYATFVGGTNAFNVTFDQLGIAVDATGSVYVTGKTRAPDLPVLHAVQPQLAGAHDAFVAKLAPDGASLVYATYLGGSSEDFPRSLTLDAEGNLYVVGQTRSSNFPTAHPLQAQNAGGFDAFVAKLAPSGSSLVYSTYFGGSGSGDPRFGDFGYDIDVDARGAATITGLTDSTDLPLAGALQPAFGGGPHDAYVARLAPDGGALEYATYLGGSRNEEGLGIAVHSDGSTLVSGWTSSPDFPVEGALQPGLAGSTDAFVVKLLSDGSALAYATYLGGSARDFSFDLDVAADGTAYVAGVTESSNLPSVDPVQPARAGGSDAFVAEISADGASLLFSSYLGGSGEESVSVSGFGVTLDGSGGAYLAGSTTSSDFPVVAPIQPAAGGQADAYVVKLSHGPEVRVRVQNTDPPLIRVTLGNGSAQTRKVELKYWLQLEGTVTSLFAPIQLVNLAPGAILELGARSLPPVAELPGTVVGARLLDPVTGAVLSESLCSRAPCN